jgi:ABC-type nickel/cobalt efflux system permease component RcnA
MVAPAAPVLAIAERALAFAGVVAAFAAFAPAASAHPLGNFSVNHLDVVSISSDHVDVHYILDQAEIPTFQERGLSPRQVLAKKQAEVTRRLQLAVDGSSVALRPRPGAKITFPPGQGGLKLTRVELDLSAAVKGVKAVRLYDGTFPGRVGWKDVIVHRGSGTAVQSSVPADEPTNGLRSYPKDMLSSPLDIRSASFSVSPGAGTVSAPKGSGPVATTENRSGDGLAGVFADAAAGKGVLLFLLLTAFGWGALHALSPGHGKAMVAAYLVGTRGTARHAVALGATVTITHTIGVFALGLVTLALSQYVLPEDLYPWLTVASGLMVVLVGAGVLRSRIRARRMDPRPEHALARPHAHHHTHSHDELHGDEGRHFPSNGHPHHHERAVDRDIGGQVHTHGGRAHAHGPGDLGWRGILGMGASAGLIPCPSALVVLLGAISQHQVGLGLVLITAFSIGLATTLTGLGLVVVYARGLLARFNFGGGLATALPAISAFVIVVAGTLLTFKGIGQV